MKNNYCMVLRVMNRGEKMVYTFETRADAEKAAATVLRCLKEHVSWCRVFPYDAESGRPCLP